MYRKLRMNQQVNFKRKTTIKKYVRLSKLLLSVFYWFSSTSHPRRTFLASASVRLYNVHLSVLFDSFYIIRFQKYFTRCKEMPTKTHWESCRELSILCLSVVDTISKRIGGVKNWMFFSWFQFCKLITRLKFGNNVTILT